MWLSYTPEHSGANSIEKPVAPDHAGDPAGAGVGAEGKGASSMAT